MDLVEFFSECLRTRLRVTDIVNVHSPGGDDHYCGVHSGCLRVPHELQSEEPGTAGEPRGWDGVLLHFKLCT